MALNAFRKSTTRRERKNNHGFGDQKNFANIYWGGPIAMFGSLIFALLLALAHHLFYQYLNNRYVKDYFLSQAWVNNVATGLAFATKLFFVIAAGIAYVEWQWHELVKREHRVEEVDAMTGVLDDITHFLQLRTWIEKPVLLLLAVMTWLLPAAAIFTPGTLSVQLSQYFNYTEAGVPQLIYDDIYSYIQHGSIVGFNGPSAELSRVSMASSTSGQILNIPSQNVNQTYSLQFHGPSLRCDVSENQGIFGVARDEGINRNDSSDSWPEQYGYISLVPGDLRGILGTNWTGALSGSWASFATLDVVSTDAARIYVMPSQSSENVSQSALIECQLWNASYTTNFSFKFPYQEVSVTSLEYLNPVNGTLAYCPVVGGVQSCPILDYLPHDHLIFQAIMQSFGDVMVGIVQYPDIFTTDEDFAAIYRTSKRLTAIDWNSTETARQGLEELFQNITLSAMSSTRLVNDISNDISNTDNATTLVMVTTYVNQYVYAPRNLLLAYGISFIVTLFCAFVGFYAMWDNQGSFQNSFSTFIRAAWHRNPNIDVWITEQDRGVEPLPKDAAAAKIRLGGSLEFVGPKISAGPESMAQMGRRSSQTSHPIESRSVRSEASERSPHESHAISRISSVSGYSRVEATASDVESDAGSNEALHDRD